MIKFHSSIRTGSDVSLVLRSLDKCELRAQLRISEDPDQQLCNALMRVMLVWMRNSHPPLHAPSLFHYEVREFHSC